VHGWALVCAAQASVWAIEIEIEIGIEIGIETTAAGKPADCAEHHRATARRRTRTARWSWGKG